MPAMNESRYHFLRSQILANAYLIYPKKSPRPRIVAGDPQADRAVADERRASQRSTQSVDRHSSTHSTQDSLPSSLVNVETWPTEKRDLEVVICRHCETLSLSSARDVFYAVVYDKNECSGYGPDEQYAQITRQRHKLKCHVLTTKPEDACETEEAALVRLCERLQREASELVMGKAVVTRLDRKTLDDGAFGSQNKINDDRRKGRRDSSGMQDIQPTGSQASLNESQIDTEVDSESQQQRLMAMARQDSGQRDESSDAFETMKTYGTQPTQAIMPGEQGPYYHQLHEQ